MMTQGRSSDRRSDVVARRKYLTFFVANEEYGVEIGVVQEIVGLLPITPIPNAPPACVGVVSLRGMLIPVLDVRRRLALKPLDRFEEFLQSRGKRVTQQRRTIVDQVFSHHDHFDADGLLEQLRRRTGRHCRHRPRR